jgi:hypothetical protein
MNERLLKKKNVSMKRFDEFRIILRMYCEHLIFVLHLKMKDRNVNQINHQK